MGGGERWREIQTKEPSEGKWQEKKLFQKKPKKKKITQKKGRTVVSNQSNYNSAKLQSAQNGGV